MIEVEHLTKRYGAVAAVSDVSFRCSPGTVTGFVGPNGAGELHGAADALRARRPVDRAGNRPRHGLPRHSQPGPPRRRAARRLGAARSAHREETLAIAAITLGIGRDRLAAVLDDVGLAGKAARKRVGTYSLGMRQRLGIAHALPGDPEVLILDEPANGRDPASGRSSCESSSAE